MKNKIILYMESFLKYVCIFLEIVLMFVFPKFYKILCQVLGLGYLNRRINHVDYKNITINSLNVTINTTKTNKQKTTLKKKSTSSNQIVWAAF